MEITSRTYADVVVVEPAGRIDIAAGPGIRTGRHEPGGSLRWRAGRSRVRPRTRGIHRQPRPARADHRGQGAALARRPYRGCADAAGRRRDHGRRPLRECRRDLSYARRRARRAVERRPRSATRRGARRILVERRRGARNCCPSSSPKRGPISACGSGCSGSSCSCSCRGSRSCCTGSSRSARRRSPVSSTMRCGSSTS